jgi:membrane protease YdiL (CAAX protease family)
MKNNSKYSTSQLFNFAQDSYLERTSRPLYAIIFLLPFILFYEIGTIFINTDLLNQYQVRVVAFVWLQNAVEYLGFAKKMAWIAPPFVLVIILLALQLTSRKKWNFLSFDIWPMIIECILFAIPLVVLTLFLTSSAVPKNNNHQYGYIQSSSVHGDLPPKTISLRVTDQSQFDDIKDQSIIARIVTSIGAGIYEELVFRLILICALMIILQDIMRFEHTPAIILSIIVSAALFSAHHHIDFLTGQYNPNDVFNWTKFTFRTIAGVYFAVLFAIRGLGITAGTHAFYDVIAVCLDSFFFHN